MIKKCNNKVDSFNIPNLSNRIIYKHRIFNFLLNQKIKIKNKNL